MGMLVRRAGVTGGRWGVADVVVSSLVTVGAARLGWVFIFTVATVGKVK
jgi:hypothetical protein